MRDFFDSIFFKIVLGILIICIGALTYTLTFEGFGTPASSATSTIITPVQDGVSSVSKFFSNIYNGLFHYDDLLEENERLKNENSELSKELRDSNYHSLENESLKELLGIKEANESYELDIAEVIGRNSSSLNNIITIDKGISSGISLNDTVITADGLVGFISRVSLNNSQITTILDPSIQVGAISTNTREIGILEGDLEFLAEDFVKLSYLDKNSSVAVSDTFETSGIGGLFPKGILIGTVSSVTIEDHGISKYAKIAPSVDVNNLNQVYIIKNFE